MEYKEFSNAKRYQTFFTGSDQVLINTLEDLFSANVRLISTPIKYCEEQLGIHVLDCPDRNVYKVSDHSVILLPRIHSGNVVYILGVIVTSKNISILRKIEHRTCETVSKAITEDYNNNFLDGYSLYNQSLVRELIVHCVARSCYKPSKVSALIDMMNAIRTTTFEGKYFSTGLLVTHSIHIHKDNDAIGELMNLYRTQNVFSKIDARFWYLVDGESSMYVTDLTHDINSMYVYKSREGNYVNQLVLANVIKQNDFLMRTTYGRELSIVTRDFEFIYQENTWRFRNYEFLHQRILSKMSLPDSVYESVIYYTLYCSKNDVSSILWIVEDKNNMSCLNDKHTFTRKNLYITDATSDNIIKRLLSSDGAVAIDSNGKILYFGCIANLYEAKKSSKLKGTGESAASVLAQNGIAIKISQDGTIKVHLAPNEEPIKF